VRNESQADIGTVALNIEWKDAVDAHVGSEECREDVARHGDVTDRWPYATSRVDAVGCQGSGGFAGPSAI